MVGDPERRVSLKDRKKGIVACLGDLFEGPVEVAHWLMVVYAEDESDVRFHHLRYTSACMDCQASWSPS